MENWNYLHIALDLYLGHPYQVSSTVERIGQTYDQRTGEHVITIQYREKVNDGLYPGRQCVLAELIRQQRR